MKHSIEMQAIIFSELAKHAEGVFARTSRNSDEIAYKMGVIRALHDTIYWVQDNAETIKAAHKQLTADKTADS